MKQFPRASLFPLSSSSHQSSASPLTTHLHSGKPFCPRVSPLTKSLAWRAVIYTARNHRRCMMLHNSNQVSLLASYNTDADSSESASHQRSQLLIGFRSPFFTSVELSAFSCPFLKGASHGRSVLKEKSFSGNPFLSNRDCSSREQSLPAI